MSCDLRRRHLYEKKKSTIAEESKYVYTKAISDVNWAVGMTVAYRRIPTVKQTVNSLAAAGWQEPYLFCEPDSNDLPKDCLILKNTEVLGNWGNFCRRLKHMVRSRADKLLFVQDDVEFLPNTRQWVEDNWPCNEGIVSLYRSARYDTHKDETEPSNSVYDILSLGRPFLGMLAVAMNKELAISLLKNIDAMKDTNPSQDDMKFGKFVHALRIPVNIAIKSRCQHVGATSSIYKNVTKISTLRQSNSYAK